MATSKSDSPISLDRFPTEILIRIARTTDFTSLYALINACHRFLGIFDKYAIEIVESVFNSSPIPDETKSYMRAVIHLRTGAFKYTKLRLDSYTSRHHASQYPLKLYNHPEDGILTAATPALLRKFVTLAHQIHILAHDLLDECLKSCHFNGLTWSYSPVCETTVPSPPPQRQLPDRIVPPSANEEQQAILGVWLTQYFDELRNVALSGTLSSSAWRPNSRNLRWLRSMNKRLAPELALDFWDGYIMELVHTVHFVLKYNRNFSVPKPEGGLNQFNFGCDGVSRGAGQILVPNAGYKEWTKTHDRFDDPWWQYVVNNDFRAFRGLGFALWDKERMRAYGLTAAAEPNKEISFEKWKQLNKHDSRWPCSKWSHYRS